MLDAADTAAVAARFGVAFDPEGRYLYFVSRRTLDPQFGAFEFEYQFDATDKVYAMTLRASEPSPVAPESDEEKLAGIFEALDAHEDVQRAFTNARGFEASESD